jgi:hypothetical protein
MKRMIQNFTILILSLILSLAMCEVGARILVPEPMAVRVTQQKTVPSSEPKKDVHGTDGSINSVINWFGSTGVRLFPNVTGHIQNHTLSQQDVVIRVNSLGFRGAEIPPRQPGQFRILFMGDSITFGDYVDESLTIPVLLEQSLKQRGYRSVVIMNAGLPGVNLANEYAHYQEMYEWADPDLVLVGMYLNDSQEAQTFYAKTLQFPFSASRFLTWAVLKFQLMNKELLFSEVNVPTIEEDWREKFRAGRNLESGSMLETRHGFDFEIYNAHSDFGLAWNPTSWEQLRKIAASFVGLVRRNKSQFVAALFPVQMQIYCTPEVLSTYPQEQFKALFSDLNVPHLDLLPGLRAQSSRMTAQEMFYDHCHYKAAGNELVATLLADWLVTENMVPEE